MNQYDPTIENTEEVTPDVETVPTEEPAETPAAEAPVETAAEVVSNPRPLTRRYNKKGRRRGKYAYAAPLGMLISLLSIIGVIALIVNVVGIVRDATDTTELGEEIYYFIEPLLIYSPTPFEGVAQEQDAFLNAAAYRVLHAEQIRMQQEMQQGGDGTTDYGVDEETGRIMVPAEEIEESYKILFGDKATFTHRSIGDMAYVEAENEAYYYVPFETLVGAYRHVIDYVDQGMNSCEIRIGFVLTTDIGIDDHGNEIEPTVEMATHFQTYTLHLENGHYYVYSCKDE